MATLSKTGKSVVPMLSLLMAGCTGCLEKRMEKPSAATFAAPKIEYLSSADSARVNNEALAALRKLDAGINEIEGILREDSALDGAKKRAGSGASAQTLDSLMSVIYKEWLMRHNKEHAYGSNQALPNTASKPDPLDIR